MQATGTTQLSGCGIPGTRGYADPAPSYSFDLSGMGGYRLDLSAEAACDATMLVHTPDGRWHFDDDGNGNLDPLISLRPPTALEGRVDVWVGTLRPTPCAAPLRLESFTAVRHGPRQCNRAPGPCRHLGRGGWTSNGFTGTRPSPGRARLERAS